MIMTFRCPPWLKEKVDALIAAGVYPDFSAFCLAAMQNQLLLEERSETRVPPGRAASDAPEDIPAGVPRGKGARRERGIANPSNPVHHVAESSPTQFSQLDRSEVSAGRPAQDRPDNSRVICVPPELSLDLLPERASFQLPLALADVFERDQAVPIGRWLFGQYNRLLPAKVSTRALAVISSQGKDQLVLESVASKIAEIAAEFGDYLRSLDRRWANHRDDALATAFPERSTAGQKGRVRYQNHFVGHTIKGEQGGILAGLKLAVIHVARNRSLLLPTAAGWDFARIANPLIDDLPDNSPSKFSAEEVAFLLQHVKEHVPTELFAYRAVLSLISSGKNTPETLNDGLRRHLQPERAFDDEQDFVTTQRNGVLGRLADMGLVCRERHGTRIAYQVSAEGKKFLDEVGTTVAA